MEKNKTKLKYNFFQNVGFMMGNMFRWNARLTTLALLRAPFLVAIPLLGIYLSRIAVTLVEGGAGLSETALTIAALCAATAACMIIYNFLGVQERRIEFINSFEYQKMIFDYMMTHDYQYNESPAGLTGVTKSFENCGNEQSGTRLAINTFPSFVGNVIGLVSYAVAIFLLNPAILLTIAATTAISFFLLRRITAWSYKNRDNWIPIDRKRGYLERRCKDLSPAKDIRLYNMAGWLRTIYSDVFYQRSAWRHKEESHRFRINAYCALLSMFREGVAYGLLVYLMYQKDMPIADFVLYFGLIGGLTVWFDGVADNLSKFDRINVGFNEMRQYFDYQNKSNTGKGIALPEGNFSIEFKDVCYQFTDGGREIFQNLNLKIEKGEKLAVVGLNGAGKTTLVKLICGLYRPTGGEILIDGNPIDAYNIEEYFSLFAAVFQDISILPMTVRQNIASVHEGADERRFQDALTLSGFDEVAGKMKNGADSYLVRGIYPDAVDLSGGEMQKLALARALYKGGKCLILDEPTAALDPIAESLVYQRYHEISREKTSVFISHRLASTKFCDRILYLEDGKIVEDGTHDELMAQRGEYHKLFEIQSHYYREGTEA